MNGKTSSLRPHFGAVASSPLVRSLSLEPLGGRLLSDQYSMWSELLTLAFVVALVHSFDHLRTYRLHGKS